MLTPRAFSTNSTLIPWAAHTVHRVDSIIDYCVSKGMRTHLLPGTIRFGIVNQEHHCTNTKKSGRGRNQSVLGHAEPLHTFVYLHIVAELPRNKCVTSSLNLSRPSSHVRELTHPMRYSTMPMHAGTQATYLHTAKVIPAQ